ncbi:MAG: Fic family protein [Deltaproteobacteria bacterium]|nr:Fic family protein [Deltaproteobacteria bacterium]
MSGAVKYHEGRFPPKGLDWERLVPLVGPATAALARYDGLLIAIPNSSVLLSPLTTNEAVLSSRIEGTQATIGEVLEYEASPGGPSLPPEKIADIHEVINYRNAMLEAERLLRELPLCIRVLREAHRILMSGVRGQGKAPGEYRRIPNWIGPPGCGIEDARYVPIEAGSLPDAMSRWETYVNSDQPDVLVQTAIMHAEFEALHPFLDGNGRLGRMWIPLFLFQRGVIRRPYFFISEYFEKHRDAYYDSLLGVSRDHDWTAWCVFFLKAIVEQAEANRTKAEAIVRLYRRMNEELSGMLKSQFSSLAVEFLFQRPIFSGSDFVHARIPEPTARILLNKLRDFNILREIRPAGGRRAAIFGFTELVNITEGEPVL